MSIFQPIVLHSNARETNEPRRFSQLQASSCCWTSKIRQKYFRRSYETSHGQVLLEVNHRKKNTFDHFSLSTSKDISTVEEQGSLNLFVNKLLCLKMALDGLKLVAAINILQSRKLFELRFCASFYQLNYITQGGDLISRSQNG